MRNRFVAVVGGVFAVLFALALFNLFGTPATPPRPRLFTEYSRFIADADEGKVERVAFRDSFVTGWLKDGRVFESVVPHIQVIPGLTDRLLAKGITIAASRPEEDVPSWLSIAVSWFPLLVFYALFYFFFARPVLAIARQIEAYVRLTQERLPGPPSPS